MPLIYTATGPVYRSEPPPASEARRVIDAASTVMSLGMGNPMPLIVTAATSTLPERNRGTAASVLSSAIGLASGNPAPLMITALGAVARPSKDRDTAIGFMSSAAGLLVGNPLPLVFFGLKKLFG